MRLGVCLGLGVCLALVLSLLVPVTSSAAVGDIGYQGKSFTGSSGAPTADKSQAKLWFNDGLWWADMFDPVSKTYHIFRLDRFTNSWVDTGTQIDNRATSRGDVLWSGGHLYVASGVKAASSAVNVTGQPARLYRYSYNSSSKTYSLDAGFPVSINNVSSESITLDRDSGGTLWATWTQGQSVFVNSTTVNDATWGTPFVLDAVGASNLDVDDLSALAAYGNNRVGLMWSNQSTSTFYFATHRDGDARTSWTSKVAVASPKTADDHINLKQLEGDNLGRVYAAVKTSHDDGGTSAAAQTQLLALNVNSGNWDTYVYGTVADCHTRPQIVLDSTNKVIRMFATAPTSAGCSYSGAPGSIYEKTTPMNKIAFAPGRGTPVIRDAASENMNDVSTTKQNVTNASGLVVLASNDSTSRYWHADMNLADTKPFVSFTASPSSGTAPLNVDFTDTSEGNIKSWAWDFGDGATSTAQNPSHTFTSVGVHTVKLTTTTEAGVSAFTTDTVNVAEKGTVYFGSATNTAAPTATNAVTLDKPAQTAAGDVLVANFTVEGNPTITAPCRVDLAALGPAEAGGWHPRGRAITTSSPQPMRPALTGLGRCRPRRGGAVGSPATWASTPPSPWIPLRPPRSTAQEPPPHSPCRA